MTKKLASSRQTEFLKRLIKERVTPETWTTQLPAMLDTLTVQEASLFIDRGLKLPYKPRESAVTLTTGVSELPTAKYAIQWDDLRNYFPEVNNDNGYLFVEVKTFKGTTYMRRLTGAPGDFTRSKLPAATVKGLVGILKEDPKSYSQEFGRVYSCCGVCAAPLTDDESRALSLGPICRKRF